MQFTKEPPHIKPSIGCWTCGCSEMRQPTNDKILARMNTKIYGGFGWWTILMDGDVIYQPPPDGEWKDFPTLMRFENMARKDPDHDWRAECFLPLRGATYQRQGKNEWVLIDSNQGFA
jgi:hypothetical protein